MTSAVIIASAAAFAASAADIRHGEMLAKQWCSNCHLIGGDQTAGGDAAPPFAAIAETAAERTDDLRAWLADPHPPMPNLNLTHYEIDDLLAYIESLSAK
ncbi:MAG: cytochrome c [Alphaproteobacteria bacterium]|nr:cytochrome c [Alphaproteobacteria bacterium]